MKLFIQALLACTLAGDFYLREKEIRKKSKIFLAVFIYFAKITKSLLSIAYDG
jgi:hypothetical protein